VLVPVAGVGLAHQHENRTARVHRVGRSPFAAVDYILVAVTLDTRLDIGRVGGGRGRLGDGEGATDRAPEQQVEPFAFLRLAVIAECGATSADKRQHLAETRVLACAEPFENRHLHRDDLRARSGHSGNRRLLALRTA
jgi:hypothetical protein